MADRVGQPGSLLDLAERGELHPDVAADLRASAERRGMANAARYRRRLAELVRRSPEKLAGLTTFAEGVDFSYTPTGAFGCMRASGRTFVCMYVKWAGRGAFEAARGAGLRPVPIYETTGTDYRGGRGAGQYAAHAFDAWCAANGYPGAPVYFTYDEDVLGYGRGGVAHDYALGWRDVIGLSRCGAYAQNGLVGQLLDAGLIARQWVTYAWSGGGLDPRVTLYQNPNGIGVCGVDCDRDRAYQPTIGAIGEGPGPAPAPPRKRGKRMYVFELPTGSLYVSDLVHFRWLNTGADTSEFLVAADGHGGPIKVDAWQRMGVPADEASANAAGAPWPAMAS